ncbi:MAG: hypothetical protein ACI9LV_000897 [Candidatus Nanohaloarchaea archaeon]|jgi:hypothetical protein
MKKLVLFSILVVLSSMAAAQGASTNLELNVTKTEPVPLQAGEYADIWFKVTNTGTAEASDAEIEIVEEFPFHTDDRKKRWDFGSLSPSEERHFRAKLRVDENAVFGENELKLRTTADGGETTVTRSVPLEVRTDDRSLVISNLDFPERVQPGSSSKMNITLENLANSQFRNIDVSLDVSKIPVAPRETNRKRITSIGEKGREDISFTLDVDGDAENQLYKMPITIKYQNQAGQEFTVTETTGVNVGGYPNIEVDIDSSDIRSAGRGTVTFRIINKGEGEARFAEISLEETSQYEILSEDSIYLGSMIADDYQTAEFELYVNQTDEKLEMPVEVTYQDGEGDQSAQFNVERELYTAGELDRYGLTQNSSGWIAIPVLLVVLGGGYYLWRRKKKE